jgi:hypothetical protein
VVVTKLIHSPQHTTTVRHKEPIKLTQTLKPTSTTNSRKPSSLLVLAKGGNNGKGKKHRFPDRPAD